MNTSKFDQEHIKELLNYRHFKVLPKLEEARQQKRIGKSLDAIVKIRTNLPGVHLGFEKETGCEVFKELLGVSDVQIEVLSQPEHNAFDEVIVIPAHEAGRKKCERCWHWETDVGQNDEHPTICGRCVEAVRQYK